MFGEAYKEKYENVRPSQNTCESSCMKGNSKYVAFPWQTGGGGSLCVLSAVGQCKLDPNNCP